MNHLPILLFISWFIRGLGEKNVCLENSHDCSACIRHPQCAWCSHPTSELRCQSREWFSSTGNCSSNLLEDPKNEVQILEDLPLTSSGESTSSGVEESESSSQSHDSKFVQISPQRIRVKLRPGIETQISFKVAHAKQYPVDLYYLMDLSNSMSDDRRNIVKLGHKLASAIQKITKDFQIGFGSFVDKEVMPFISLVPDDNCQQETCPGPYSFQHHMSLSSDAKLFTKRVQEAPISGNIDNPEGGFDALLQVMVCDEQIGWRAQSRRVVIFTTDQSFHIACDGKLGGIVRPNDGLCHLNASGYYTHSRQQDYPSIGQINHIARNHSVNIIWAVTADKYPLYKSLEQIVIGSSAGIISADSSNVVELVRQQYAEITTTIKVETNASANVNAKISTKCLSRQNFGPPECENVELGTPIDLILTLNLSSCVAETFIVTPVGLKEQMVVEIEPICECPCSKDQLIEDNLICQDPLCNRHGHLVCGKCHCCGDFFGPHCECSGHLADATDPSRSCRPNGTDSDALLCSGRGKCVCGECFCDQQREGVLLTGQYCESICDNTACERDLEGRLCSGRGDCICEFCKCQDKWKGEACQCYDDDSKCRSPETPHLICSGNGECPCDKCICTEDGYSGEFCEVCVTCKDQCSTLRPCLEYVAFNDPHLLRPANHDSVTDEILELLKTNCSRDYPFIYEEVSSNRIPQEWNNCSFIYNNCEYTFAHADFRPDKSYPEYIYLRLWEESGEGSDQSELRLRCPPKADFVGIFLAVVGCILCVGLVTIFLWKAFTTIHDRQEFARFEAERQRMKLPAHSNPIFHQATTTIQNPIFNSPEI